MIRLSLIFYCALVTVPSFGDRVVGVEHQDRRVETIPTTAENIERTVRCNAREIEENNSNPEETCHSSSLLVDKVRRLSSKRRQQLVKNEEIKDRNKCQRRCEGKFPPGSLELALCVVDCFR
jgi:hypothetical protein